MTSNKSKKIKQDEIVNPMNRNDERKGYIEIVYRGAICKYFIESKIHQNLYNLKYEVSELPEHINIISLEMAEPTDYNKNAKTIIIRDIDCYYYKNILEIMNEIKQNYPNLIEIISIRYYRAPMESD